MATPTTPTPGATPLPAVAQGVSSVIATLGAINAGIPVIMTVVTSIIGIVKALRGTAPPMAEIIAQVETTVAANDARGTAEIARLRAALASETASGGLGR